MILIRCWRGKLDPARLRLVQASLAVAALALFGGVQHAAANDTDFATWLQGLKAEAHGQGISQGTLDRAFANVRPIARVIELDRKQPEFTLNFEDYVARVVNQGRVEKGRALLAEHRALLDRIGERYGVPPRVIVALWGVESDFGRITGDFPVIDSLATLAYDGRRSGYFRNELFDALRILERGHIDLATLRGSWAGAMGQSQFMPSSYLRYAVDYEGKGHRDIWHNLPDIFASTANYLAKVGWRAQESWGQPVLLPAAFDAKLADLAVQKQLVEWNALGVRASDGGLLSDRPLLASVIMPAGEGGPTYAVYDNFRAIMKWNRSTFFATAVGLLADRIGGQ